MRMMACWKSRKMRKKRPTRYFVTRDAIDAMAYTIFNCPSSAALCAAPSLVVVNGKRYIG
jgi:hypothetical protein